MAWLTTPTSLGGAGLPLYIFPITIKDPLYSIKHAKSRDIARITEHKLRGLNYKIGQLYARNIDRVRP